LSCDRAGDGGQGEHASAWCGAAAATAGEARLPDVLGCATVRCAAAAAAAAAPLEVPRGGCSACGCGCCRVDRWSAPHAPATPRAHSLLAAARPPTALHADPPLAAAAWRRLLPAWRALWLLPLGRLMRRRRRPLTLKRSARMEGVIILYLGTSDSSLSYVLCGSGRGTLRGCEAGLGRGAPGGGGAWHHGCMRRTRMRPPRRVPAASPGRTGPGC
jgi:hypothetical protein